MNPLGEIRGFISFWHMGAEKLEVPNFLKKYSSKKKTFRPKLG